MWCASIVLLFKQGRKNRETRVYLLGNATAIAILKRLTALLAKAFAILRANYLAGEIKKKRFGELFINVKLSVVNDNVFVNVLLDLLLGKSSFIGDDSFKNKLKLALDRLKASVTLGLIRKMSRGTKTHITCVVSYLSVYLRVTLEGNSVKGYGRDGVIKGEAALFSAEKRAYI